MNGILGIFGGLGDKSENEEMKASEDQNRTSEDQNHTSEDQTKTDESQKLRLRKEELNIAKNRVDIGKVEFGKEIIEEQQTINVPVIHEEVIIERKSINEPSDKPIGEGNDEHFSLSVSEEKVEVSKQTVITSEISAHKREIEENREIKETIKHEEARINKDGNANIVDDVDQLH
jgi:uncharacterized protein (TIGR02271 family)